jgi:hypothetical protein
LGLEEKRTMSAFAAQDEMRAHPDSRELNKLWEKK